jgi:hypothetical protein
MNLVPFGDCKLIGNRLSFISDYTCVLEEFCGAGHKSVLHFRLRKGELRSVERLRTDRTS